MAFPPMTSTLLTDTVTLVLQSWGNGADDDRAVIARKTIVGVRAAVQPGDPTREVDISDEGLRRVTGMTPFTIDFQGSPYNLKVDDLVLWTDPADGTVHTIAIEGIANLGGGSGTWQATGTERT